MIKVIKILKKYTNSNYPFWAEHDVLGFCIDPEIVSKEDIKKLEELDVFYSEEYDSLIMFV